MPEAHGHEQAMVDRVRELEMERFDLRTILLQIADEIAQDTHPDPREVVQRALRKVAGGMEADTAFERLAKRIRTRSEYLYEVAKETEDRELHLTARALSETASIIAHDPNPAATLEPAPTRTAADASLSDGELRAVGLKAAPDGGGAPESPGINDDPMAAARAAYIAQQKAERDAYERGRADEREACAQYIMDQSFEADARGHDRLAGKLRGAADAIRQRGQKGGE